MRAWVSEVYVSVCVYSKQFGQGVHIYTTRSKDKKLLPYKVLCGENAELFCLESLGSSWSNYSPKERGMKSIKSLFDHHTIASFKTSQKKKKKKLAEIVFSCRNQSHHHGDIPALEESLFVIFYINPATFLLSKSISCLQCS